MGHFAEKLHKNTELQLGNIKSNCPKYRLTGLLIFVDCDLENYRRIWHGSSDRFRDRIVNFCEYSIKFSDLERQLLWLMGQIWKLET